MAYCSIMRRSRGLVRELRNSRSTTDVEVRTMPGMSKISRLTRYRSSVESAVTVILRSASPVVAKISSTSGIRSEEHTSELQSRFDLVCRLLLEKQKESKRE